MVVPQRCGVDRDRHGDDVGGQWGWLGRVVLHFVWGEIAVSALGLIRSRARVSIVRTDPRWMRALGDCSPSLSM